MAYKIFLISAQKDADLVIDLTQRLERAGIKVLSKKTQASEVMNHWIRRSLGESDEVFVLLTGNSLDNAWVTLVLGAALGLHKPITAIVAGVSEDELLHKVGFAARHIKYADFDKYISELHRRPEKVAV
jgi:hypothetical protein